MGLGREMSFGGRWFRFRDGMALGRRVGGDGFGDGDGFGERVGLGMEMGLWWEIS